jgi:membrane protein YdbS with pleckstrin-like domain
MGWTDNFSFVYGWCLVIAVVVTVLVTPLGNVHWSPSGAFVVVLHLLAGLMFIRRGYRQMNGDRD